MKSNTFPAEKNSDWKPILDHKWSWGYN